MNKREVKTNKVESKPNKQAAAASGPLTQTIVEPTVKT